MEEEFHKKVGRLQRDHLHKVKEDERKYLELIEEKNQLKTAFLNEITLRANENEQALHQMHIEWRLQKEALKREEHELDALIEEIKRDSRKSRAAQEERMWKQIDVMTDQNKVVLAGDIEKGMDAKAKLTVALNQLKDKNTEKDKELRMLEERKVNFEDNKQQTLKLKSNIEQHE